ncbi:hypothetical protein DNJ95_10985 [Stutzerimonas kirkiae]|uniref:Filamentous haemagglutinin FhaB/tRNA nuclease CdiA-like TPS domain-containing protein n=1 Tax=Stutzerimonas kirkiae TaxID=2211392 RepID=A0A4Q9R4F7_9GAMM|nr:hemagglutinin repeat-containing protein [Stutzerimonas kirkiae]TBU94812.1 hypothetical protein DNJ96_12725 [Stutzerimonas kirkiae]TBV01860.1 hypothetical protein DNJ95_10985 [Stutzerimonas kirkiae]
MNHIFRIIWSRVRHAFVVVSENTRQSGPASSRGRGRASASPGVFVLGALSAALFIDSAMAAGVEVASGNTQVFNAPNGVQVIDIATANAAGLSHNRYIHYNVDASGQVLNNNSVLSQAGALQSQLAGQLVPNVNLTNEARVILNEVVAPNRSSLGGYTEVVGGKADVIVANPYGITCSGCGFINTDRATLTTGTPVIGGNGALAGFQVRQGDILVEGNGLDGRNQQVLDLLARQVKIDGQINGNDLQVVAGSNDYDYAERSASAQETTDDAPLYAIDSSALGGMYAQRIRLIATEGGVGVRMRGEAAASADDFVLDAAGRIEINTSLSAAGDLALSSAAAGQAIRVEGAASQLTAGRDLALSATEGTLSLDDATLTAARDVLLTADSLDDGGDGQRYAGRDARIETGAASRISGSTWGAGDDLSIRASSLALDDAARLYSGADEQADGKSLTLTSTHGALQLNQASVQSSGALALDAAQSISTGGATELKSAGDFSVRAVGDIEHAGRLLGGGAGEIQAGGNLDNDNLIHAAAALQVKAASISNSNTAGISSREELSLEASVAIDNAGALYAGEHLSLKAGDKVHNQSSGTVDSNGGITSESTHFVNNGAIVGVGDIHLEVSQSFVNETLWSGGSLSKRDGSPTYNGEISNDQIANEGGISQENGMNAWLIDEAYSYDEQLVGLTLDQLRALQKAQIIANGAGSKLTIEYGSSGLNKVGVLSAPNLEISGSGIFRNEELALYRYEKVLRWIRIEDESSGNDDFIAWARTDPDVFCYVGAPAGCSGRDDDLPNSPDDDYYHWDNWSPGPGWTSTRHIETGSWPSALTDEARALAVQGGKLSGATVIGRSGAGIYASTFTFSGGTLENVGSPWADDPDLVSQAGLQSGSINTPNASAQISLPSNPNGNFITSKDPAAKYLVESNPLYAVGSDFVGSNYLAERYGFNPDTVQQRLGDANYEAYLIRQQLIEQTGNNVIAGYDNEADQMQRLMDQAYNQGQALGLVFGQTPSAEQLAALSEDIVWMEEVEVNGQKVLAPRVYLAASTVAALDAGAVIAAGSVDISGDGLSNTGGTISGSDSLTVNTTGDIRNTSGTLKGGDVSLTSSEGSIRNETLAIGQGDDTTYTTAIGKTAAIQSTGNLSLDAARNVEVIGASVSAEGSASLAAGGDIIVDTIVDKNTSTRSSKSGDAFEGSSSRISVSRETNIGSQLDIEGNLSTRSGGDTTIAGSQVDVGGDLDADAGGSFNVIARQDKLTVETQESVSGAGVGGGLYGTQTTTTSDFTGTNVGSTLNVGGNAKVAAGEQIVLQGSDVNIDGDASLEGKEGISILDGLDEQRTSTLVETTTFMKLERETETGAGAAASAEADGSELEASASAEAEAGASASTNLKLMETSRSTTNSGSNTSVASNLNIGGTLGMKSDGTVTVQGSNVAAGGDLDIEARDLQVLTGRNESWSESETTTTSVGIYVDSEAKASAKAEAEASGKGSASASAEANASAESTATAGLRYEREQESSYDLVNSASTLGSGGNMRLKVQDNATFQGAEVSSGGDMEIDAGNIRNLAAQDISTSSKSSETHTIGVYAGASAEAKASAEAEVDASGLGQPQAGVSAEASASAEVSAGLRQNSEMESSSSTDITQVTNTFTSGGNFSRTAKDTIVDQGTQVEAGGNISQSARVIRDEAVSDQSYSSESSHSHDVRVGAYAGAEAEASLDGTEASAGYGAKASAEIERSSESSQSSTAVTSAFKAGGSISSQSTEKTTLVGAQFEAGEDIDIQAGSLDVQAARDTSSSSSSEWGAEAEVKAGVGSVEGSVAFDGATEEEASSTARAASINAGGKLNIRTTGDARFEGSELSSGGDTQIDAGGDVEFAAARDTQSRSANSLSLELGASGDDEGGSSKSASAGVGLERENSDQAQVGSITSGGSIKVRSGGDTTLEGTQVEADGDVGLSAGGKVQLKEAESTSSSLSLELGASAESETADGATESGSGAEFSLDASREQSGTAATIQSTGKIRIEQGR